MLNQMTDEEIKEFSKTVNLQALKEHLNGHR